MDLLTIVLIVGLSCMTMAFVCALCVCVKQHWSFECEQNALASALNNKARQKDCAKGVAHLTADELIAQKNEEIASLNDMIAKYEEEHRRNVEVEKKLEKHYGDAGISLSNLIGYTEDCRKTLKHDYIERGVEYSCDDIDYVLKAILREEICIVERLPNYYPQIGEKIDCACMEEVGEKNYGYITQIVEPGKKCGTFVVRKAKVKTERRIQE